MKASCITTLLFLSLILFSTASYAQTYEQYKADREAKFQSFKSEKQKKYDDYRRQINEKYASFMAQKWAAYQSFKAQERPKDQDIPKPVYKQGDDPVTTNEVYYKVVITLVPYEVPEPIVPIDDAPDEVEPSFDFIFHGTPCAVHLTHEMKVSLKDNTEKSVADMWRQLSTGTYDALIADCLELREDLQLNDWGYIELLKTLTTKFYETNVNEATVMQMYILTQSGYTVRIARKNERLVLLIPFDSEVYGYSYFTLDDQKFYFLDTDKESAQYYIYNHAFPQEKNPSLRLFKTPDFAYKAVPARKIASKRYPNVSATIYENKNLIDFYDSYPHTAKWAYYTSASLSEETKNALYPVLRREVKDKPINEAANILINFVQTAFEYQTDGEQFGYERPLFGDETLYYPYSDCEDRAILYSILVREILGLEVIIVSYPGHLATAVNFPNNTPYGAYFQWNNKVYTICDPTYIGADIGECMPKFCDMTAELIQIAN